MNKICWNCGSEDFINSISLEFCPDCNIKCDYSSGSSNKEYDIATEYKQIEILIENQKNIDKFFT